MGSKDTEIVRKSDTFLAACLIGAIVENNVQLVSELLNQGVNPNDTIDHAKITPLHFAVQNNALEVIPLLIEAGAVVEVSQDAEGNTPVQTALCHGNHRIAQLLLAYAHEQDRNVH